MKFFPGKKLVFLAFILFFAFTISACSNSSETSSSSDKSIAEEDVETITLKFASYFAGTSPIYYGVVEPWMERVTELTDGQVQFEYYPSEQLGKGTDLLDLTKNGVTDISITPSDYNRDQMPVTSFLSNFPGLSESVNQGTLAINKLIQENDTVKELDFLSNGVYPILGLSPPSDDIWSVEKEIRTPDDLKGYQLRTKGGMVNSLYEKLGATPLSITFSEIYEALERGVVDGVAIYNMGVKNGGFDELVTSTTPLQIGSSIHFVKMNLDVWEGLPENVQDAMIEAAKEVSAGIGAIYDADVAEFMAEFEAKATVVELTEDEKKLWNDVFIEWGEEWIAENSGTGVPYEEILEEYREYLEEFK